MESESGDVRGRTFALSNSILVLELDYPPAQSVLHELSTAVKSQLRDDLSSLNFISPRLRRSVGTRRYTGVTPPIAPGGILPQCTIRGHGNGPDPSIPQLYRLMPCFVGRVESYGGHRRPERDSGVE